MFAHLAVIGMALHWNGNPVDASLSQGALESLGQTYNGLTLLPWWVNLLIVPPVFLLVRRLLRRKNKAI